MNTSIFIIARAMMDENLPLEFISSCINASIEFEGILDLANLWYEEVDVAEKKEILNDIEEMLFECNGLF